MELFELQRIWKETDKDGSSSKMNENVLMRKNYNSASTEFEKLLKLSVWGRNLALAYFIVSFVFILLVHDAPAIVIPGIIGAVGMLLSFVYHFSYTSKLQKLNYYVLSVVELQKTIGEFRIKSLSARKYDLTITLMWIATLLPMIIHFFFNKNLYTYFDPSLSNALKLVVILLILFAGNERMYKKLYEDKLLKAEADLKEIMNFQQS